MLFKVLSKTVLMGGAGGAGGAVYLSNSVEISNNLKTKQLNLQNPPFATTIKSLEDIGMFERFYDCKFAFISAWPETYNFEGFLKKHKENYWEQRIIDGANRFKQHCKDKKVATLLNYRNSFSLKTT